MSSWRLVVLAWLSFGSGVLWAADAGIDSSPPATENWRVVSWADLPGWSDDAVEQVWPAFLKSCNTKQVRALHPSWTEVCRKATAMDVRSTASVRAFFETLFRPWGMLDGGVEAKGLLTGYYEPVMAGEKKRSATARFPVRPVPQDLLQIDLTSIYPDLSKLRLRGRVVGNKVVPYPARADITRTDWLNGDGRSDGAGEALAWLDDPVALFFLQVQGSGRIRFPDGEVLRVGYGDSNGHPYESIGKVLIQRGELSPEAASMQGIQAWARANPDKIEELLGKNPSYVFFRALTIKGDDGPLGALGVPLESQRSIAIDPSIVPLGVPVYLAAEGNTLPPNRRLTMAQDTGAAIKGPVRADFYWGSGDAAGQSAGKTKQALRMWLLLPHAMTPAR